MAGVGYTGWSNTLEIRRSGVPRDPAHPLRVAFLSDAHAPHHWVSIERLASEAAAFRPDMVCIGGDAVERGRDVHRVRAYGALRAPLGVFAVLGNWEYYGGCDLDELRRTYASVGVRLLVNERVVLADGAVELVGLDDWVEGSPDYADALAPLVSGLPGARRLVLSHCPITFDRLREQRVDLARELHRSRRPSSDIEARGVPVDMLCGHTHGGQIAPFGYAIVLPTGAGDYVHGWYEAAGVAPADRMYVTRGIGNTGPRLRIGAQPELSLLTL
ncbi:MAG: hypothetical protein NVS1B4_15410 [Gemmatimonadaceae bacterium]